MKQKVLHRQKQTEKKTTQAKITGTKLSSGQTQIQTQENVARNTQRGNETREKALINYKSGGKVTELLILK